MKTEDRSRIDLPASPFLEPGTASAVSNLELRFKPLLVATLERPSEIDFSQLTCCLQESLGISGPAAGDFSCIPGECYYSFVIAIEDLYEPEWVDWFRMTPQERWEESAKLWHHYVAMGGSLDPEPDPQSPFYDPETSGRPPVDGRPGLRVIRRSGV